MSYSNLIFDNSTNSMINVSMNTNAMIFTNYLGSKQTKTLSGLVLPEKVWYVGNESRGVFKDTLAKAKSYASGFRPERSVVVVEFDLLTGNRNVLMDYVPGGTCESCDGEFDKNKINRYDKRFTDPLAKTQFESMIICGECYRTNSKILDLRRRG